MNSELPNVDELINPTFVALKLLGGSGSVGEINEKVIALQKFSDEVLTHIHNDNPNQTEIAYRLAWARTYLKRAGVINNTKRGIWIINSAFESNDSFNAKELVNFVKNNLNTPKQTQCDSNLENSNLDSPIETEAWRRELKNVLYAINPFEFEKLTQLILREAGFAQVEVTKRTGDGGIDGFGKFKINGIISFKLAFQCKRYKGLVSPADIRSFRGSMTTDIEKGILITTGSFSRGALEEASADGKKHIDLLDGEQLIDKLIDLKLGVIEKKTYDVDYDFFERFNYKNTFK